MLITRRSMFSGITRTKEINILPEQLQAWQDGGLIQNVAPHLSAEDREFIVSGVTSSEWDELYEEDEEDYYYYDGLDEDAF